MARKKEIIQLPVKLFVVLDPNVTKMLGPHKVIMQGDSRLVALNDKQAKYYLTTGAIEARSVA